MAISLRQKLLQTVATTEEVPAASLLRGTVASRTGATRCQEQQAHGVFWRQWAVMNHSGIHLLTYRTCFSLAMAIWLEHDLEIKWIEILTYVKIVYVTHVNRYIFATHEH